LSHDRRQPREDDQMDSGLPLDAALVSALEPLSPRAAFLHCCAQGVLAYQVAQPSGTVVFYPRLVAPGTGETTLEWRRSRGRGAIHALTRHADTDVALVDMAEGFRLLGPVSGGASIGAAVEVVFHRPADGDIHPAFRVS